MSFTRARSNSSVGDWYAASYSNHISRLRTTPFMPGANFDPTTAQLHQLQRANGEDDQDEMDAAPNATNVRDRVQVMDSATGLPMTSRQIAQATDATNQTGVVGAASGGVAAQKKKGQTLFGPDVGFEEADAVGGWTKGDPVEGTPTVPLAVVKSWIERAKQTEPDTQNARVHKTTTLQAMVNLKRPSLSLIALMPHAAEETQTASHALRFTYDVSAPAVLITVSVHPRAYPLLPAQRPIRTIYSATHPGGFGKTWQLPQEFAIDLSTMMDDELRVKADAKRAQDEEEERRRRSAAFEEEEEEDDLKKGRHAHRHSHPPAATNTPAAPPAEPTPARSRFGISGILGRRQRRQDEEQGIVAGIRNSQGGSARGEAIEMQPTATAANADTAPATEGQEKEKHVMDEDGIRLLIRLDALDAQGTSRAASNIPS